MESLELIMAKLVLGYLKSEKCKIAHREFLRTSSNFRHLDYERTKYMPTRYHGLTLGDILVEYFEISRIIEGRLEATNYFNENYPKTSLLEQLLYLLNKVPSSRASTPTPSITHGSVIDCNMSPNHSDLEATPIHTLPGNAESDESYGPKTTPRKKDSNRHAKCSSPHTSSPIEENRTQVFDTESLAHNLMENTEFQEKIAQTINKVIERQYKERDPEEFDRTIKTAVEEAQADPIFEELLQDILGSTNMTEGNKNAELNNTTSITNTDKTRDTTSTDMETPYPNGSGQDHIETQTQGHPFSMGTNIPEQANYNKDLPQAPINILQHVVTYGNSFDNYIVSSNCGIASRNQCIQNPVYINTMGGLLIPTTVDPSQPFMVLSKPTPIVTPGVLTEQDIMKMPVILKDSNQVIPPEVEVEKQGRGSSKSIKSILPQPAIHLAPEAAPELKAFFKNFMPLESETSTSTNEGTCILKNEEPGTSKSTSLTSKNKTVTAEKRVGLKKVIYPKASRKSPRPTKRPIPTSKAKSEASKNTLPDISGIETEHNENIEVPNSSDLNTPAPPEPVKKPTPKSGSHVRNLNFSTPPKVNSRRKSSSPRNSESATVQKNQAVKTLFKKANMGRTWDADLRAVIPSEAGPSKKPPTTGNKRSRKKGNKAQLNTTTEREALLLEAAIKTPIKSMDDETTAAENEEIKSEIKLEELQKKPNSQVKTILSPSKLNNTAKHILDTKSAEGESSTKFVTPDMPKQAVTQPMKANRNITPMLETPIKLQLPKTPGVSTPGAATPLNANVSMMSTTTPFTQMLEANLNMKTIDINSIPTPNLPITPGFPPFTPTADLISPYPNRPTDYSTGSSYYQPSDNEQNKNLEAHLREIEKTAAKAEVAASVTLSDHMQIFNRNVIGKKNLSLVKNSLESDSSSGSSSDEEEESGMDWCDKETNDTVIFKKKFETPRRTYCLRTRSKTEKAAASPKKSFKNTKTPKKYAKTTKKEIKKTVSKGKKITETNPTDQHLTEADKSTEGIKNILNEINAGAEPSDTSVKGVTASQVSVLMELEKKRMRMRDSLKHPKTESVPKTKKPNCKFKIKPIAKVYTSKKNRKCDSPKKRKKSKDIEELLKDLITSDDSDVDISLKLSEDEDEVEKVHNLDKTDKISQDGAEVEKDDKIGQVDEADKAPPCDVEAQNLIEGLKERGIHLMHNKSPKKKGVDGETIVNTSSTQLETLDREHFDVKTSEEQEEDIRIVYDETQIREKEIPNTCEELQTIEYIGKLYLESIGREVNVHLKQTDFYLLFDTESYTNTSDNKLTEITTKEHVGSNSKKHKERLTDKTKTRESADTAPVSKNVKDTPKGKEKQVLKRKTETHKENARTEIKPVAESTSEHKSSRPELIQNKLLEHKKEKQLAKEVVKAAEIKQISKTAATAATNKKNNSKAKEKETTEHRREKQSLETKIQMLNESVIRDAKSGDGTTVNTEEQLNKVREVQSEKFKQNLIVEQITEVKSIVRVSPARRNVSELMDSYHSGLDKDTEDELMNFASTGREKEDESVSSVSSSKKRRLSDEDLSENSCKKMLRTLDVDSFLNKIHADTKFGQRK